MKRLIVVGLVAALVATPFARATATAGSQPGRCPRGQIEMYVNPFVVDGASTMLLHRVTPIRIHSPQDLPWTRLHRGEVYEVTAEACGRGGAQLSFVLVVDK